MPPESTAAVLKRLLDPVGRCLNAEAARGLVELRADPEVQRRIDELADKSTSGTLTPEERADYETYVAAANVIAILQAKARSQIATQPAA